MAATYRSPVRNIVFLLCAMFCATPSLFAANPGIQISATNVSISGQGTATSRLTITAVNGFSGQMGIGCWQDFNAPQLVVPVCPSPMQAFVLPVNGTATGSIKFSPPWTAQSRLATHGPELALLFGVISLLGLRIRGPDSCVTPL